VSATRRSIIAGGRTPPTSAADDDLPVELEPYRAVNGAYREGVDRVNALVAELIPRRSS